MTVIAITAPQAYSVSFSSTSSRMAFLPACWQQQYSVTWWLSFHQKPRHRDYTWLDEWRQDAAWHAAKYARWDHKGEHRI